MKEKEDTQTIMDSIAATHSVEAEFSNGHRKGDVIILKLNGERVRINAFYAEVMRAFPGHELELFNVPTSPNFGMIAALIDPHQATFRIDDERRKNIRKKASSRLG